MTEPVRFPANVPYDKWPSLYGVFTAMEANDWALAQQRWNDGKQNCLDSAGAIQMGYDAFKPSGVPVKMKGTISRTPYDFTYEPGFVMAFQATVDSTPEGGASGSAGEGSEGLYAGVFDTMPDTANPLDEHTFTTWGRSSVYGMPIKAGQFLLLYQVKQAELSGRADVR